MCTTSYTIYAAAYKIFMNSFILSSKSGILWIYGAFKTTGNSAKNKVKWCQWSSDRSSRKRPEFPICELYDHLKGIFSAPSFLLFWAEVMLDWQHGQCWMFICLSLEKRALNPDLGPRTHSTEKQASDCFAMLGVSHWFLPNHSLLNMRLQFV
jgi:hypothetical protein